MNLKQYQSHSLHWLRRYYQECRKMQEVEMSFPASMAFMSVTGEIHEGQGLPYAPVKQVPGIPYVCLRIPTGGGKTLVACEAVSLGVKDLLQQDRALILWLVPSDTIRSQTLSRLKDSADPYRQALDTTLGNVAVLDIEEATRMKRALLDSHTVIVVRLLVEPVPVRKDLAPYKGRLYDPAYGSGGMFVQSEKFVESHGGQIADISIYGQESNPATRRLAIMNLALRGNEADWFRKDDDVRWQFLSRKPKSIFTVLS